MARRPLRRRVSAVQTVSTQINKLAACRDTIVLDTIRILVDALMQLRGRTQRKRAEKLHGNECRDKGASVII
jgi:hypothetical protein